MLRRQMNKREVEILQLVALDMSDQEIADRLQVSVRTVNNQLAYIYAKLGVKGRAGAVAVSFARGLIGLRPTEFLDEI